MRNYSALVLMLSFAFTTLGCKDDVPKPDVIGVWIVQEFKTTDVYITPPDGDNLGLNFRDENSFTIGFTVNSCGGIYSINSNGNISFEITDFCTQTCCDSEESDIYGGILLESDRFTLEEDELIISSTNGEVRFRRFE